MDVERVPNESDIQCKGSPMCKYGKPYSNGILSCCTWCKLAVECFLIAGRDYEGEFLASEVFAETCYTLQKEEEIDGQKT